jgi:rubrerythrin
LQQEGGLMIDSDSTRDLFIRGKAAAKAGDIQEALFYLNWLLRLDPPIEQRIDTWHLLSEISTDPVEKRKYLEEILSNNLGDAHARRKLAILDGKLDPQNIINPDKLQTPMPNEKEANDLTHFICPQCGGRMTYAPDGNSLTCEYCESKQEFAAHFFQKENLIQEENFMVALATKKGHFCPITTHTLTCRGCGAKFLFGAQQITGNCPYCQTPYALNQIESEELIVPNGIIPFQITENAAKLSLKNWFVNRFGKLLNVAPGKSLYVPAWTFDIGGQITWHCFAYKNQKYVPESGQSIILQNDILVLATRIFPQVLKAGLDSFNLKGLKPFDNRYLASKNAETYQTTAADASLLAREIALHREESRIATEANGQYKELIIDTSNMLVESYKLILLPVWLTTYQIKDKRLNIIINGQTGKVIGEEPGSEFTRWMKTIFTGDQHEQI